jgi:hypothetical protein
MPGAPLPDRDDNLNELNRFREDYVSEIGQSLQIGRLLSSIRAAEVG